MKKAIIAAAALTALATAWVFPAAAEEPKNTPETYRLLNLFGDVFERVRNDYVDQVTDERMVEAAVSGMLSALDPHSSYLNAKSYREMQVQTRGHFGGLGIQVTMENGLVKVISPIDDTPAARAGIEPGDFVTHLDREPVQGLTLEQAVEKMRGKVGTDIKLTIRRGTREPFDVTLTRAVIQVDSVKTRVDNGIGIIRITSFNERTDKGLEKAIETMKVETKGGLRGVVLDLRNNPGGLLEQAVAVSDAFLDKGEIVSTRSRKAEEIQRYNAKSGDLLGGLPLVVLINGGSASASEIVAGALQDHKRAVVMGVKSFGKGSVQSIIPLPGHGAMRLTTARYYTPSGRSIQAKGIEPDIEVKQAKFEEAQAADHRSEADLRGALDKPATATAPADGDKAPEAKPSEVKPDAAKPPAAKPGEAKPDAAARPEAQDYQLQRAIDLLRGLAFFAPTPPQGKSRS